MKLMNRTILTFMFTIIIPFILVSCSGNNTANCTFPNIDNANIPDILEKVVGTLGDTYFTSFAKSDNQDYQSYLRVTFKDITEADYTALMQHYQADSTGTNADGAMLFDWGWLSADTDENSININAYIK